jgi:threonine/homoserine/homoserine lactone efflux protein
LAAYLAFTAILVLTPGATTAVVVRSTLHGGRTAGFAAATGAALGNASHAALAGLGLAVVFARWPIAMSILRLAGGCYLAWLGSRSLYRVFAYPDGGLRLASVNNMRDQSAAHANSVRQGLTVNILNPAIATFYLVVVPSFIPPHAPSWYFATLAMVHIAMAFVCHGAWAIALDALRRILQPPPARRTLEGATGVALLALAARILANLEPLNR